MKKICVVITARGNYAKMKHVMREISSHPDLELQVILGGSVVLEKYGKLLESDHIDSFKVNHTIHFLIEGETPHTMAKSAGLAVTEFANSFKLLKPDLVMVIADRFECLAIAMASTYMNIPIAHIEGGEVSGSIDESIRHAITKMAHIHFPCSDEAARRIIKLGENPEMVHNVGSTSFDVLASFDMNDLSSIKDYQEKSGVGALIDIIPREYLVVIQHPVTTEYSENFDNILQTLNAIETLKIPTFLIWPNMDAGSDGISKGIRIYRETKPASHVHFFKSLPFELYAPLLKNAACVVGNSSSGIREAAYLGTPTVNIGTRQTGRQRADNVMDVPYDCTEIKNAVLFQKAHGPYASNNTYGDGSASKKIVNIIANSKIETQKIIQY